MDTVARIKRGGENFEIIVDLDQALKFKKGETDFINAEIDKIFKDSKKGFAASTESLQSAFGTTNVDEIVKKIVKEGEVLVSQEHRDEEKEKKIRQIVEFLSKNATNPQTGNPHTSERIRDALEQSQVNVKNTPIETQIKEIVEKISKIIPITLKTKKVKVVIPAIYTGKAYSLVNQYKEKEEWLNDGSLEIILSIPSGAIIDFYDKLNSITHGSALTEEIKEKND